MNTIISNNVGDKIEAKMVRHTEANVQRKIELFNIVKCFNANSLSGKKKNNRLTAINGVTMSVQLNRITVIKGPSGSGKTTLLSIVGCMSRPTAGRIYIDGKEITSLPERFLSKIRRDCFGFVFQHFNLIHGISALENIMLPAFPTSQKSKLIKQRAIGLLEKLKIASKARERVEYLSGGELQRVAIARALINDPDILIADEPTAHLNTNLAMKFLDIMTQLLEEGKTVMIASHDPLLYESDSMDGVIGLRDGRIVETKYRSGKKMIARADALGSMNTQRKTKMINGGGNDRRSGNNRRSGNDRRTANDRCVSNLVWFKKDRRTGIDRRSGKERRVGS